MIKDNSSLFVFSIRTFKFLTFFDYKGSVGSYKKYFRHKHVQMKSARLPFEHRIHWRSDRKHKLVRYLTRHVLRFRYLPHGCLLILFRTKLCDKSSYERVKFVLCVVNFVTLYMRCWRYIVISFLLSKGMGSIFAILHYSGN